MRRGRSGADREQHRGIDLKRIPTYSFPLMLEVMQEQGVAPDAILEGTGLDAASLAREGTLVSFLQALKFVRNLLHHSARPDIGLAIGNRYHISTYGVLGYAMMSCANWEGALRIGRRFHRVASSLVAIELDLDPDNNLFTFVASPFYPDFGDIEPFTMEKLFSSLVAVSRPVLPEPAYPCRVTFTYPEPAHAEAYAALFPCPIEFGAAQNRFELDLSRLQQPLLAANDVCAEMGRRMCEEHLSRYNQADDSTYRKVTELLLAAPNGMPGMDAVAEKLHVSSRTLRRQLQDEGTTFQAICDTLRHDLSRHYLQRSQLSLDEIAHLVGFTESTNFRRAFKRWQGVPPAEYRRQQQASLR